MMRKLLFIAFLLLMSNQLHAQCNIQPVNLGNDTSLCQGQTLLLNAAASGSYDTYLWNNGSTATSKFISTAGTYWVKVGKLGNNVIVNGDFEQGNTGFATDYTPGTGGSYGLLSNEGTYAISSSPSSVHNNFVFCNDHTPAPGTQMLIVNGSNTPNTSVWCQTVTVQPNTDYQFATWASSALFNTNVAILQFSINGTSIGSTFSPSTSGCSWSQYFQVWNSGSNTSATICIINQNTGTDGNDFMIDDISFKPVCYSTDTIVVNYNPLPVVNLGPDQNLCGGTNVTLDAQNPGSSYLWSTGDVTQTISPTTTGNYGVTVTTPENCSASDAAVISFETPPDAGADTAVNFCHTIGTVDLMNYLTNGTATSGHWSDDDNTMNGELATTGIVDLTNLAGNHNAYYVIDGTWCPNDTSVMALTVYEQPDAGTDNNTHVCNENGDQVDMNTLVNPLVTTLQPFWQESSANPSGQFDASNGILDVSALPADDYTFDYILPADSPCLNDTATVIVKVTEMPVVQFSSDVLDGCEPLDVNLLNESVYSGVSTVSWVISDGTTSSEGQLLPHQFAVAGSYDVFMSITSDGLCTSTLDKPGMITVYPNPKADFTISPQQLFSDDPTAEFDNSSVDNDQNYWTFGDGETSTAVAPVHTYPIGDIGNYEIWLHVETVHGCTDSTFRKILVKDQLLYYIPNTFTPDNDEFNQQFLPIMTAGFDPGSYVFKIYNRWGEVIFETHDISVGWDGTYNGEYVPQGTYSWTLELADDDNDGKYTDQGHLTLLR